MCGYRAARARRAVRSGAKAAVHGVGARGPQPQQTLCRPPLAHHTSLLGRSSTAAIPPRRPAWQPRAVRLALLVDSLRQPAWVADVLSRASREGAAEVVGVGLLGVPAGAARPGRSAAEDFYLRVDARRYGRPDASTRPVDLGHVLPGVAPASLPAGASSAAGALVLEAYPEVAAWDADIVWYLGGRAVAEPVPDLAHLGVWTLDPPAGAVGGRAMVDGHASTDTTLRRLGSPHAAGAVLACVRTSTERISLSVNRSEHLRHVAEAVAGWLRRASRFGPAATSETLPNTELADAPDPGATDDGPLSPGDALRLATRTVTRLIRPRLSGRGGAPNWRLAYHFAGEPAPGADRAAPATDFRAFTEVWSPADRYWADPFPAEHGGRHYVLYEEHLAGVADAHLCAAEVDPVRGLVDRRVVLQREFHLSFPSIFHWDGTWYMTPEAATTGAVQLYRATDFPDGWEYVTDLVTGARFVDPVVTEIAGAWWLFVGVLPPGAGEATALHLYHAPAPTGPWEPHLLNPVTVDVRSARPAGRAFTRDGHCFRPVQDGAPYYGHAMTIRRIDVLTPAAFRETVVARVDPTWRPRLRGTHTLNAAGRLTMMDVLAER